MTALLADAVYIAATDAVQTSWPKVSLPNFRGIFEAALHFIKQIRVGPVLPYATLFEANLVAAAMADQNDLRPPDPFSTESAFLTRLWPRE